MGKVRSTRATQLAGGGQLLKGGDMRKLRSPLNHQLATPVKQADGSEVVTTQNGQSFKVTRMK